MKMVRAVLLAGFAWLVGAPAFAQVNVPFSTYITGVAAVSSVSLTERIVVMKSGAIQTMTPAQILAAVGGDCTMASPPSIVCTKTNGAPFAASATTDATNANNISSGTLGSARGGAGTLNGALKANGSGVVSVAACADLSDDAPSCSTDTTNATNISSGTLNTLRLPSPFTSGTRRGNTSSFVTYAGSAPVTGHIATYDVNGNVIDGGSTGSGTVTTSGSPTTGQIAVFSGATVIAGFTPTVLTNSLTADVALSATTTTYVDGPSVAQGTSGTWVVSGNVLVTDTATGAIPFCKLWDGTTMMDSGSQNASVANSRVMVSLSGIITNPAGNLRISCANAQGTSTSGMRFNSTGNSRDGTISAYRIQ